MGFIQGVVVVVLFSQCFELFLFFTSEQISLLYRNGAADNQIPIMTPLIQLCDVTENIEHLQHMANLFHTKYSIKKIMV